MKILSNFVINFRAENICVFLDLWFARNIYLAGIKFHQEAKGIRKSSLKKTI